jgi:hypothetical protein
MTTNSTWTWSYETETGDKVEATTTSPSFPSQSDAESWIGETWAQLLSEGVDAVSLFEDERHVYGPMSLHPATPAE